MSEDSDVETPHPTRSQLYSKILKVRHQTDLAWDRRRYGDDGAEKVFAAAANDLREAVKSVRDDQLREDLSESFRPSLGKLAYIHELGFHLSDSGVLHPAKFSGKVRSVRLAGPPGSGKRP
ncbi:hypothetical protein CVS30_05860 [Arthrobacter psychrolactophilus]|uniref:Uncharacterized protein n=1 Tax=Arthrobacter psychrolactophilus TaxID=92442 RepID=A0A2V5IU09_9MICC|nr:hypothetical protein [Arthrobacter psychrolactophilus]PYI39471.1 hypothetical protein CVS30_05860 [Arthrobacter psychrolactophilus]